MAIQNVDISKCIGCKKCVNSCPMDVIRFDEASQKAVAKYKNDCVCCYNCELDCPTHAIFVDPKRALPVPPAWF